MLDFGLLPPEITSTRIYTGPGAEPTMVAASAWDALAAELDSFAAGYDATISSLQDEGWLGPASNAMAAAAAPYAQWAASTAERAQLAASQARAAAAAFEAAHAAVVPPPLIAANRTQLLSLVKTNILGQNTAQIAATEAAYEAMWVQDASAMHSYATSASSATKLAPFTGPPPTTNPVAAPAASAAAASQSTLSQVLSSVPQLLSAAGTSAPAQAGIPIPEWFMTLMTDLNYVQRVPDIFVFVQMRNVGAIGDALIFGTRFGSDGALFAPQELYAPAVGVAGATSPATASAPTALASAAESADVNRAVLASVGETTPVGRLSVPASWTNATPAAAATQQWLSSGTAGSWDAAPKMQTAGAGPAAAMGPMAGAAGAAAARKVVRPSISTILQVTPPRYKMPRHSSGG
ncbi:PPE family protein [Candidatus Mycobacterium methanotrophicum]|uniref:PPE family protein n=1 Tax=Candidatus Mycobacterium methanotrophicum TaxID=2943498 RepID=A0ABY4QG03_9MYCO|nr:PPE family protein [Candidatus Mycobacterium methanotrophicum]UQX09927.1 PPE family protein [Candidatus Mycobacterium methanotrophicum]